MSDRTRSRCLALILMLLLGQTALLVHAATHFDQGKVQCQLCVSQAQLGHGLVPQSCVIPALTVIRFSIERPVPSLPHPRKIRPYFQRAPPAIT